VATRNSGGGWTKNAGGTGAATPTIPVGGMYRSTVDVTPATQLGYGVWTKRTLGTMQTVVSPEEVAYVWERTA